MVLLSVGGAQESSHGRITSHRLEHLDKTVSQKRKHPKIVLHCTHLLLRPHKPDVIEPIPGNSPQNPRQPFPKTIRPHNSFDTPDLPIETLDRVARVVGFGGECRMVGCAYGYCQRARGFEGVDAVDFHSEEVDFV